MSVAEAVAEHTEEQVAAEQLETETTGPVDEQVDDSPDQPAEDDAASDKLLSELNELRNYDAELKAANLLVSKLAGRVDTLKEKLKAAKAKEELAVAKLRQLIWDHASAQKKLPFPAEATQAEATAEPPHDDAGDRKVVDALGAKAMLELLGQDEIDRRKGLEEPVGLTDKECELLESHCTTVAKLEQWMREDAYWSNKIGKGWGDKKTEKLINTLTAFREKFPIPQVDESDADADVDSDDGDAE